MYNPVSHVPMESFTTPNCLSWTASPLFCGQCSSVPDPCQCRGLSILNSEPLPFPWFYASELSCFFREPYTVKPTSRWAHLLFILSLWLFFYHHPAEWGSNVLAYNLNTEYEILLSARNISHICMFPNLVTTSPRTILHILFIKL